MNFTYRPLDLNDPTMVAAATLFRRDAFIFATGNDAEWVKDGGADGSKYIAWLQRATQKPDALFVQCFDGDICVGQIEAQRKTIDDEDVGYINLFYLIPEHRGKGYGRALEQYATQHFSNCGVKKLQLASYESNDIAMRFYQKQDWVPCGTHHSGAHLLNKIIN